MTRILVTGAGGFVGRHVMAAFAQAMAAGDRLVGLGREASCDLPRGAEWSRVDLLDAPALRALVTEVKPTHVLHLAALSSVGQAKGAPAETWRVNVAGSINLAEAVAAGAPESAFFFVSSGEVYGRAFLSGGALTEQATPQPANAYARTKYAGELMVGDILPAAGVKLITVRPFNHVGKGQDERFVLASFARQIARIERGLEPPVLQVGDLSSQRDFLDVKDVVSAYSMLLKEAETVVGGSIYNICSGRTRPISQIVGELKARSSVSFEICVAQDRLRPSEIPIAAGDSSAIRSAIGWQPTLAWGETLETVLCDARARVAARLAQER